MLSEIHACTRFSGLRLATDSEQSNSVSELKADAHDKQRMVQCC